jgi:hypothetical protein
LGVYKCFLAYPAPSSRSTVIRMAMVVMVIVRPVFWTRVLINVYVTITKAQPSVKLRRMTSAVTLVPKLLCCHTRLPRLDPCGSASIRGQHDPAVEKLLSQFGTKADIFTSAILDDN